MTESEVTKSQFIMSEVLCLLIVLKRHKMSPVYDDVGVGVFKFNLNLKPGDQ